MFASTWDHLHRVLFAVALSEWSLGLAVVTTTEMCLKSRKNYSSIAVAPALRVSFISRRRPSCSHASLFPQIKLSCFSLWRCRNAWKRQEKALRRYPRMFIEMVEREISMDQRSINTLR